MLDDVSVSQYIQRRILRLKTTEKGGGNVNQGVEDA